MEKWRKINDYPNYSISNMGRVRNDKTGLIKKYYIMSNGYCIINLNKNNIKKSNLIHRLVAKHFIPNPENKLEVNHIDGIKTNNFVENLEWSTHKENMKHASIKYLFKNKLTKKDVIWIRKHYIKAHKIYGQKPLAIKFNVSQATIGKIINRKSWKYI